MCNFIKPDNQKCTLRPEQEWCGHHDPDKKKKKLSDELIMELCKKIENLKSEVCDKIENLKSEVCDKMDGIKLELYEKMESIESELEDLKVQQTNKIGIVELKVMDAQLSIKKMHRDMSPLSPPSRTHSISVTQESYDTLKSFTIARAVNFDNSLDSKSVTNSSASRASISTNGCVPEVRRRSVTMAL